jgi:hypothetical protein
MLGNIYLYGKFYILNGQELKTEKINTEPNS